MIYLIISLFNYLIIYFGLFLIEEKKAVELCGIGFSCSLPFCCMIAGRFCSKSKRVVHSMYYRKYLNYLTGSAPRNFGSYSHGASYNPSE